MGRTVKINTPRAQVEEVTSVLTPAPGVSLQQALADAQLQLPPDATIEIDEKANTATIRWFKRKAG